MRTLSKQLERRWMVAKVDFSGAALNISWRNKVTELKMYGALLKDTWKVTEHYRLSVVSHFHHHQEEAAIILVLWDPRHGKVLHRL